MAAFPVGWSRKCALTCDHTKVGSGGVSGYPGLVTETSLYPNGVAADAEILVLGGANAAQSDGGDIRFSSDAAGASQLACEVVLWAQNANPALAKAEIHVNCSLSSAVDTPIYVWYNAGGGLSQPTATAAFGSQAVWDANYKGVWHFKDGSSLSFGDSTSNGNNGTGVSAPTATAGKLDGGISLNGANQYVNVGSGASLGLTGTITASAWINTNLATSQVQVIAGNTDASGNNVPFSFELNRNGAHKLDFLRGNGTYFIGENNTAIVINTWYYATVVVTGSPTLWTAQWYLNGVADGNPSGAASATSNLTTAVGSSGIFVAINRRFSGILDEVRLSASARTAAWILTEYNNQDAPASFWTAGTPGPVARLAIFENSYRQRR